MADRARHSHAKGRRRPSAGGPIDLAEAFGLLASALERARELPGRLADAAELNARLAAHRDDLEICLARAMCEAATAGRLGRDFSARRAAAMVTALDEEIADADAMIAEVERVARRLRREARSVDHRLELYGALLSELPTGPERERALALVERERASLAAVRGGARRAASPELYTLTRVEVKQTGHAR